MSFFITSDTHFGHRNIFEDGYCPRRREWMPAPTVEAHDEALIEAWNAVIGANDVVIHCGDFAFGSAGAVKEYRRRLNGTIWLVRGNHDRSLGSMRSCFAAVNPKDVVGNSLRMIVNGHRVVARHVPLIHAPPNEFSFSTEEAEWARELWHGHVHDRAYEPASPKFVAFGIDRLPRGSRPAPHNLGWPVTLVEVTP